MKNDKLLNSSIVTDCYDQLPFKNWLFSNTKKYKMGGIVDGKIFHSHPAKFSQRNITPILYGINF